MKIIKPGVAPKEAEYRGECQCGCIFEVTLTELTVQKALRWVSGISGYPCPTCDRFIYATSMQLVQPQLENS